MSSVINLSIIVPTFNNLNLLKRCIQSVEKQLDTDDELLIINDGSSDGTFEFLRDYCKHKKNIFIKNQINAGSGTARNNGIFNSRNEYIWFIDSDDYIEENAIKKIKEQLRNEDYELLFFDYKIKTMKTVKNQKLNLKSLTSRELLLTPHVPWNKIIKKELLNDILFPMTKIRFQDHATMPAVIVKANKIGYLAESLYVYDFTHLSNISKNHNKVDDMYAACDYLMDYYQKGIFTSEEIELVLIKSLIFYKIFDQSTRSSKEIKYDLDKIKKYLNKHAPNWRNSAYLTNEFGKQNAPFIRNIKLKLMVANVFKNSTVLTWLLIFTLSKIKLKLKK